jgi:hypothetical protein
MRGRNYPAFFYARRAKENVMRTKRLIYPTVAVIMLILAGFAPKAMAQETLEIPSYGWGIRAGLSSDPDQVYGGVHFDLGELTRDVRFRPTVEVGFGDDRKLVQMLAELHYLFSMFQTWEPYLGGGLGLTYVDYDTGHRKDGSNIGGSLNAIAGMETEITKRTKLFFEFKLGLAHEDPDIKFGVGLSWK